MKSKFFVSSAVCFAISLSACGKSADQRFEEMYIYQKANDPEFAKSTEEAYRNRANLPDSEKLQMVEMYDAILKQRKVVEGLKRDGPEPK